MGIYWTAVVAYGVEIEVPDDDGHALEKKLLKEWEEHFTGACPIQITELGSYGAGDILYILGLKRDCYQISQHGNEDEIMVLNSVKEPATTNLLAKVCEVFDLAPVPEVPDFGEEEDTQIKAKRYFGMMFA